MFKRSLFAVGVLALLSACSSFKTKEPAWDLVCTHSDYTCVGIKEPVVVEADLVNGIYGEYFPGDQWVILRVNMEEPQRTIVLVHEMVHYLQWSHGKSKLDDPMSVRCKREKEAFDVSYEVSLELGAPDTQWFEVAPIYGCLPF
jgi:hypothetical protein